MSWNGKQGMKMSGGLGNSVFQPKAHIYPADGSGRDVHCFTHARAIDTKFDEPPKFNTQTGNSGRNKSPTVTAAAEHVPRRQPDGSGRDGYIHFTNGGLYSNYKPSKFGDELRGYEVIHKPRFGKDRPEFDDYQKWFDSKTAKTKLEQSRLVNRLVGRLNPTSKASAEQAEKDQMLSSIVNTIQTGKKSPEPTAFHTINATTPGLMTASTSPIRQKQVTTMEQKRIKRKVLKVMDSEEGSFATKLRAQGDLSKSVLVEDWHLDNEMSKLKGIQTSTHKGEPHYDFATMFPGRQQQNMLKARMNRVDAQTQNQAHEKITPLSPVPKRTQQTVLQQPERLFNSSQKPTYKSSNPKNILDLFVNDSIIMPSKQKQGRNLLCKSVQGNVTDPEKRIKLERIFTTTRDDNSTPLALAARIKDANALADHASRLQEVQAKNKQNKTTTSSFYQQTAQRQSSTAYGDSRREMLTTKSIEDQSRFRNAAQKTKGTPQSGYISIRPEKLRLKKIDKLSDQKMTFDHNKDSRESLHAISISADPSRAGSRCGSVTGKSSVQKSILGVLSERLRTKQNRSRGGPPSSAQINEDLIYPVKYPVNALQVDRSVKGASRMQERPKTQIKTLVMRTDLAEKTKIVNNIVNKQKDSLNRAALESFQNSLSDMPNNTRQAGFLAKVGGDKSPYRAAKRDGNGSPFESLKFY